IIAQLRPHEPNCRPRRLGNRRSCKGVSARSQLLKVYLPRSETSMNRKNASLLLQQKHFGRGTTQWKGGGLRFDVRISELDRISVDSLEKVSSLPKRRAMRAVRSEERRVGKKWRGVVNA